MATKFAGNGLSRTAMIYKIATLAGHKLTVPELNSDVRHGQISILEELRSLIERGQSIERKRILKRLVKI